MICGRLATLVMMVICAAHGMHRTLADKAPFAINQSMATLAMCRTMVTHGDLCDHYSSWASPARSTMPQGAATRATHGHATAMAAWDEYDWLKRVVDEDIYQAQALRELADAMAG